MRRDSPKLLLVYGKRPPAPGGALERVFTAHRLDLLRYLTRILGNCEDAEEIAQETYVKLMRAPLFEQLTGDAARRYLLKTGLNLARDRLRQQRVRSQEAHVSYAFDDLASEDASPDEIVDWNAGMEVVKGVLLDLPPRHRQVFLLHVMHNMSYRNIAKRLAVSTKTVERDLAIVLELCQSRLRTADAQ
jgi:RNA polymerase sigma-70 factor (ECF subfamily)